MRVLLLLVAVLSVWCEVFFQETFDDASWQTRWVPSQWKGGLGPQGKWKHSAGKWFADAKASLGLQTSQDMHYHSISAKMTEFSNKARDLVVQFTVKHEEHSYGFCGGGYIKLLPKGLDQTRFGGESQYSIMFGPDLCSYDVSRIHLIFTDQTGKNLLKKDEIKLEYDEKNEFTHLYTLVLHPDHTFEVYFDQKEKAKGSLFDQWDFPGPSKDDPTDSKPSNWVDTKEIADPNDKKPSDYDSIPSQIPDPDADKPEEWDDELDGEWEAPMVPNPEFKGEWTPKMIPNPAYKGEWKAKQIPNPDYSPTVAVYDDLSYVGFELWTVNNGSIFDNIYVGDSYSDSQVFAAKTWGAIKGKEKQKGKEDWEKLNKPDVHQEGVDEDEDEDEDEEEVKTNDEL
eukprot:NODE_1845_length_1359_cov_114.056818_g1753_i0.p1 GENE.NODE_1845_length_1359_cov_114.056818_g1753_i0~~NODE_1845_length_1359_cov_114.056818_g1753_i0.p1  ORF type:complete len:415 (+),score=95.86 NODE_1845_length_1359_cov_114.056818_g1753_i0:57-1247(+)